MRPDILVRVDKVAKKYCRSLRRSLSYGAADVVGDVLGRRSHSRLRKGEFWALRDVSLELQRGECLGLIGRNGAGKTTLLKLLNGLFRPDIGQIEIKGRVGALIALGAGFNPILTGRENIYVNGAVLGLSKRQIDQTFDYIVAFSDLEHFIDTPVRSYSSGMQARLGFSIASSFQPDVLLVDEVLAVGDEGFRARSYNRIGQLRSSGCAVVLVTHNLQYVTRFCSHALLLDMGTTVSEGEPDEVLRDYTDIIMRDEHAIRPTTTKESPGGSKRVEIARFDIEHESVSDGMPIISSVHGLRMMAEIDSHLPSMTNCALDMAIQDNDGVAFQHTLDVVSIQPGKCLLRVEFPNFYPNNQRLRLSMSLWDSKHLELFDWVRNLNVLSRGDPSNRGKYDLPYRVTVTQSCAS